MAENMCENRHELRKELKLLKIENMKRKKHLRLAMRVRFLNRNRLEGEITDLNLILSKLKTKVLGSSKENEKEANLFKNPNSLVYDDETSVKFDKNDELICAVPKRKNKTVNFKYFCDRCEFKSIQKTAFDIHVRRHEGVKPFMCDVCKKTFTTKFERKLHKITHFHKVVCEECGFLNNFSDILMNSKEDVLIKGQPCKMCGHINIEKHEPIVDNDLSKVINNESQLKSEMGDKDKSSNTDKLRPIGKNVWICDFCKVVFKQKKVLTKHMRTHTGERPFSCDSCEYAAASKNTLVIHKRKHTGEKPYVCTYCSFRCATRGYLTIHLNKHLGIKPFACDQCDYRSVDSCKLTTHRKVHHSNEKPFVCDMCSFQTKLKSRLKKHMIVHGPRPFVCHYCAKTFTIKRALQEHEGIHTGNQQFQCKICKVEKKFTLEVTFKNHLARHQLKYSCKLCDYKTDRKKSYNRHEEVHQKGPYNPRKRFVKSYQCKICKYSCSQLSTLMKHGDTKHPNHHSIEPELQEKPQSIVQNTVYNEPKINIPSVAIANPAYNPLILNIPNTQNMQIDTNYQNVNHYPLAVNYVMPLAPTIGNIIDFRSISQPFTSTNFIYSCDQCEFKVTDYNELTVHKNTAHLKESDYINYFREAL